MEPIESYMFDYENFKHFTPTDFIREALSMQPSIMLTLRMAPYLYQALKAKWYTLPMWSLDPYKLLKKGQAGLSNICTLSMLKEWLYSVQLLKACLHWAAHCTARGLHVRIVGEPLLQQASRRLLVLLSQKNLLIRDGGKVYKRLKRWWRRRV